MDKHISRLNPLTRNVLHVISVVGMYMVLFGAFYLAQKYTIGLIPFVRNLRVAGLLVTPVLFSVVAVAIITRFFEVSSPYRKSR